MDKLYVGLLVGILIGLSIGAEVAWVVKPVEPALACNKIGIIFDNGGIEDKSFNYLAYSGAVRARDELGVVFDYAEPRDMTEYESLQTNFAKTGTYSLIICVGFNQAEVLNKVAKAYPSQNFAIIDAVVDQPNVASLMFKANEGSFLTGVVAGMMTKTDKLGFVGGMDIPPIRDFFIGYKAGAEWANSNVSVLDPVFVGDWDDSVKGKELAISLVGLGADGILACAGKSGLGTFEGVHEQGIMGFGVDACQDYLYPTIIASATKRVDIAVYEIMKAALISAVLPQFDSAHGGFRSGSRSLGIAEGWTGCSRLPDEESFWESRFNFTETPLPGNVLTKLLAARDGIIAGNIVVPS